MTSPKHMPLDINFQCYDAFDVCLAIEREGISFYEQASKGVENPGVKKIFQRLAGEEKEHSRSLQVKGKYLRPALKKRSPVNEDVLEFIQNKVRGQVFPLHEGKGHEIPNFASDEAAISFGMESERRSIEILSQLLEMERKIDVRAILAHLIVEEKKHLAALEKLNADFAAK